MPDASLQTSADFVQPDWLPACCIVCGSPVAGHAPIKLSAVVDDIDRAMQAPIAFPGVTGFFSGTPWGGKVELVATKALLLPVCSGHLARMRPRRRGALVASAPFLLLAVAIGFFLFSFLQPAPSDRFWMRCVGVVPFVGFLWLLTRTEDWLSPIALELPDANRVVFRNVAPKFAEELARMEWRRTFGDQPITRDAPPAKPSDNPFE